MASEKFANNAASTLNGSINNSVTSLTVASATGFPSAGQFRILIDSEIMIVTAVSGTTFTVTRGAESTSAASHTTGAALTHVYTAGAVNQSIADEFQTGVYSSLPAAEKAGRIYVATDMGIRFYDNGSAWVPYYDNIPLTAPSDSGFSWQNQGSATVDTTGYGTYIACATNGNTAGYRSRIKTHTAPKKYTVAFTAHFQSANSGGCGFLFRESSTSKFVSTVVWGNVNNTLQIITENWTNDTTFSAAVTNGTYNASHIFRSPVMWLQFEDDNTNLYWRHSTDGFTWMTTKSSPVARTTFFGTAPNQFGYFVHPRDQNMGMRILSWKEE